MPLPYSARVSIFVLPDIERDPDSGNERYCLEDPFFLCASCVSVSPFLVFGRLSFKTITAARGCFYIVGAKMDLGVRSIPSYTPPLLPLGKRLLVLDSSLSARVDLSLYTHTHTVSATT